MSTINDGFDQSEFRQTWRHVTTVVANRLLEPDFREIGCSGYANPPGFARACREHFGKPSFIDRGPRLEGHSR